MLFSIKIHQFFYSDVDLVKYFFFQIQFVIIFYHNFAVMFSDCNYPKFINFLLSLNAGLFIYMFGKFYYVNYLKSRNKAKIYGVKYENKILANGTSQENKPLTNGINNKNKETASDNTNSLANGVCYRNKTRNGISHENKSLSNGFYNNGKIMTNGYSNEQKGKDV